MPASSRKSTAADVTSKSKTIVASKTAVSTSANSTTASASDKRRVRKNRLMAGTYMIKKYPFRALLSALPAAYQKTVIVSEGAVDVLRHALESTLGRLLVDADVIRSITAHDQRDTVFWTDILAALSTSRNAPPALSDWIRNERQLYDQAVENRQMVRALGSRFHKYVATQKALNA